MTIRQLLERLEGIPIDTEILIASDSEGNSYSLVYELNANDYNYEKDDYEYIIGLRELTPEFEEAGYGEDDVLDNDQPCVVIWP